LITGIEAAPAPTAINAEIDASPAERRDGRGAGGRYLSARSAANAVVKLSENNAAMAEDEIKLRNGFCRGDAVLSMHSVCRPVWLTQR